MPPEFNRLWDNDLSLIQDIGKDKKKYSITLRHEEKMQLLSFILRAYPNNLGQRNVIMAQTR